MRFGGILGKQHYASDIILGEKYIDKQTGFEGTATATYFFQYGCERVQIETFDANTKEIRNATFDAPRLTHVDTDVRVTTERTGGQKGVKPQKYNLVPVQPLALLAELYGHGASKYAAHNWRRGYPWSNSYDAAMRHLTQFWNGEDFDPEMGTPHVINAAFHMFALAQFMTDFPEFDDRYKNEAAA